MKKLIEKIIGSYSGRELKRLEPIIEDIEVLEEEFEKLTDTELKSKTGEFKKRIIEGETLDELLPEAFATVREASKRTLGMRHFKVQLIGGVVLHQGRIAEMRTGEGKTLAATLPVYLNALEGKGVHIITVNDYLAKRDSEWMGKIYSFLGLSVGLVIHGIDNKERKAAYLCDITYGTNNEFGFDYLRDNMVIYKEEMAQRKLHYAIVDEVDSILVDEARTPLIISGAGDKSTELYKKADQFVSKLSKKVFIETDDKKHHDYLEEDYIVDEKGNNVTLTEKGMVKAERYFGLENLSDPENMTISHHINQALKAIGVMKRDKDYVVKNGAIIIVDEFTGRMMFGRRYSNGLHQAIEAKERVKVERESKTLATITFQNYFRIYEKLAGMTGTALTEEEEFREIYNLDVIVIPTNMPMIRNDCPDAIFKNEIGKYRAVIKEIIERHKKGQPVLIGTITIEKSELLSKLLSKSGIKHNVLNAKYHEKEAEIIAQAGKFNSVTIATNMAGRGTDIVLGGNTEFMAKQEMKKRGFKEELINESTGFNETDNEEILDARKVFRDLNDKNKKNTIVERNKILKVSGLAIIGTERHESRRIDNQLRGRSGRQGDPGESKFFISLDDDLMRLFGSDRMASIVNTLGLEEDQPIEHKMLSNAIESAQKRVEGKNFDIRKRVLQYDDVMNKQREVIYGQRKKVLDGDNLKENFQKMITEMIKKNLDINCGDSPYPDYWEWEGIANFVENIIKSKKTFEITAEEKESLTREMLEEDIVSRAFEVYESKEKEYTSKTMRELERIILLRTVDSKWMDHLDDMEQLRQGIGLRSFAQRDPVVEYKFEGFEMFEDMIANIQSEASQRILSFEIKKEQVVHREKVAVPLTESRGGEGAVKKPFVKSGKVGRNDPCTCGSGKKYKRCCGLT